MLISPQYFYDIHACTTRRGGWGGDESLWILFYNWNLEFFCGWKLSVLICRTYVKGTRKGFFKIIRGQLQKWGNIRRKRCLPQLAQQRYGGADLIFTFIWLMCMKSCTIHFRTVKSIELKARMIFKEIIIRSCTCKTR